MADIFQPGDRTPCSGIYRVVHAIQHASSHHVIALYGEIFPHCQECTDEVRFELARSAVHVSAHPLFLRV
jgi:hypothetical protein